MFPCSRDTKNYLVMAKMKIRQHAVPVSFYLVKLENKKAGEHFVTVDRSLTDAWLLQTAAWHRLFILSLQLRPLLLKTTAYDKPRFLFDSFMFDLIERTAHISEFVTI